MEQHQQRNAAESSLGAKEITGSQPTMDPERIEQLVEQKVQETLQQNKQSADLAAAEHQSFVQEMQKMMGEMRSTMQAFMADSMKTIKKTENKELKSLIDDYAIEITDLRHSIDSVAEMSRCSNADPSESRNQSPKAHNR